MWKCGTFLLINVERFLPAFFCDGLRANNNSAQFFKMSTGTVPIKRNYCAKQQNNVLLSIKIA